MVREIDTEDGICKTYERVELKQFVCYYSRRSYQSANKFGSENGSGSLLFSFHLTSKRRSLPAEGGHGIVKSSLVFQPCLMAQIVAVVSKKFRFGRKCQRQARGVTM